MPWCLCRRSWATVPSLRSCLMNQERERSAVSCDYPCPVFWVLFIGLTVLFLGIGTISCAKYCPVISKGFHTFVGVPAQSEVSKFEVWKRRPVHQKLALFVAATPWLRWPGWFAFGCPLAEITNAVRKESANIGASCVKSFTLLVEGHVWYWHWKAGLMATALLPSWVQWWMEERMRSGHRLGYCDWTHVSWVGQDTGWGQCTVIGQC